MEGTLSSPSKISCFEDEEVDPRVQVELEKLNTATDEINRLEATLEEANHNFRSSLNETSVQLQVLAKKLGTCVEKARPYYEAKEKAKKLQLDCQRSAVQYQRANAIHQAARETISLAEERFANLRSNDEVDGKERKFDSAWQEMLNHATMKIMEAEAQKSASEREHQKRAASYTTAEKEVQELQRKLRGVISKSLPYFNLRASTQVKLEAQKDRISKLQKDVTFAKNKYSFSLRNLEHISEEIHELRRINMKREPGVGAEGDGSEPFVERAPPRSDEGFPTLGSSSSSSSSCEEDQKYWSALKARLDKLHGEEVKSRITPVEEEKRHFQHGVSILIHQDNISIPYENTAGKNTPRKKNMRAENVLQNEVLDFQTKEDGGLISKEEEEIFEENTSTRNVDASLQGINLLENAPLAKAAINNEENKQEGECCEENAKLEQGDGEENHKEERKRVEENEQKREYVENNEQGRHRSEENKQFGEETNKEEEGNGNDTTDLQTDLNPIRKACTVPDVVIYEEGADKQVLSGHDEATCSPSGKEPQGAARGTFVRNAVEKIEIMSKLASKALPFSASKEKESLLF